MSNDRPVSDVPTPHRAFRGWVLLACAGLCVGLVMAAGVTTAMSPGNEMDLQEPAMDAGHDDQGDDDRWADIDPEIAALPAWTEPPPEAPVRYAFAGDVHGEGGVRSVLEAGGNPFELMAPALEDADVTMVNLETAVAAEGAPEDKQFTFNAPLNITDMLAISGVDVVSLANNHAMDYGAAAMLETRQRAEASGLAVVGAGQDRAQAFSPHLVDVDGITVAIVGTSRVLPATSWFAGTERPGIASAYDLEHAVEAVSEARQIADRVVVFVHWGTELAACPDEVQRQMAGAFAAAGADVIVGHHPHVLQGIEVRDRTLIAYSLGNFAFYARDADTSRTGVLQVDQVGDQTSYHFVPAVVVDGIPTPAHDEQAQDVLDTLSARSPGGAAGCDFG